MRLICQNNECNTMDCKLRDTTFRKQSIKKVSIPLNKFNDVAVPHHVEMLKKHKGNIQKFQLMGDWNKVHHEQINAARVIRQLKHLLYEMDVLRNQVQNSDLIDFDKLTDNSRRHAQDAIKEYFDLKLQGQKSLSDPPSDSTHSLEKVDETTEDKQEIPKLQIQLSADSSPCEEECLRSMENLQEEVKNVYELFEEYSVIIKEQKEKVNEVENNVEESAINVEEGACNLVRAANYKATMYPIAGAVLGGCLGGPIGLIAGFKLGGLAAVGCGVIGFTGGQLLKKKHRIIADERGVELVEVNHSILPSSQISAVVPDGSRSTSVPTVKKIL